MSDPGPEEGKDIHSSHHTQNSQCTSKKNAIAK